MNIIEAGMFVCGYYGSSDLICENPLFENNDFQDSMVLKYHGAGSVKF